MQTTHLHALSHTNKATPKNVMSNCHWSTTHNEAYFEMQMILLSDTPLEKTDFKFFKKHKLQKASLLVVGLFTYLFYIQEFHLPWICWFIGHEVKVSVSLHMHITSSTWKLFSWSHPLPLPLPIFVSTFHINLRLEKNIWMKTFNFFPNVYSLSMDV